MITIRQDRKGQPYGDPITIYPKAYKWDLFSVNDPDSGRTISGDMIVNRRTQKRKLEITVGGLTWKEASDILKIIDAEYCWVTFPDMVTGNMQTKRFYPGDRTASAYMWTSGRKILQELTFNVIEV